MSLLLDALYKASKDKEKANELSLAPKQEEPKPELDKTNASQELQLELPEPIIERTFELESPSISLAIEPEISIPVKEVRTTEFPTLELELEPRPVDVSQPLEEAYVPKPDQVVEIEEEPVTPVEQMEHRAVTDTIKPSDVHQEQPKVEAFKTSEENPLVEPPVQKVIIAEESKPVNEPLQSKSPDKKEIKQPGKIAQILSRSGGNKKSPTSTANKRVLALVGIASVLLLALGALYVFVGTHSSGLTTVATMPQITDPSMMDVPVQEAPIPQPAVQNETQEIIKVDLQQIKSTAVNKNKDTNISKQEATPAAQTDSVNEPPKVVDVKDKEPVFKPNANRAAVTKSLKTNPLEVAYAALLDGRFEEAGQSYAKVLKTNPYERDALLGLAYIAHQRGRREDALDLYQRVIRQDPSNSVANAAVLELDTRLDGATASIKARDLVDRQPESVAALMTAANAMVRDGKLADAANLFVRAQRLEPDNPVHVYNHAVALDTLGQYAQAIEQYKKVIKIAENQLPTNVRPFSLESVRKRLDEMAASLNETNNNLK